MEYWQANHWPIPFGCDILCCVENFSIELESHLGLFCYDFYFSQLVGIFFQGEFSKIKSLRIVADCYIFRNFRVADIGISNYIFPLLQSSDTVISVTSGNGSLQYFVRTFCFNLNGYKFEWSPNSPSITIPLILPSVSLPFISGAKHKSIPVKSKLIFLSSSSKSVFYILQNDLYDCYHTKRFI